MSRLVAVGNWFQAHEVFHELFDEIEIVHLDHSSEVLSLQEQAEEILKDGDVLLFGGGADICTKFYGQKPNSHVYAEEFSNRDKEELAFFNMALELGLHQIGICRGAQLLCALSGGSLIQHVDNHAGRDHTITTVEGMVISVSSAHHQMMNPFSTEHELLAWSSQQRSPRYLVEHDEDAKMEVEPEVVYFPQTKSIAMQYHPEFMSPVSAGAQYARDLVAKFILEA